MKISVLFSILLFCLASISASYAGYTAFLSIHGDVDTWTPTGNCRSAGFWKTECSYWMTGNGHPHIKYEELCEYLSEVYHLYYDDVFGCTDIHVGADGISVKQAYDILSVHGGTMEQKLRRQLLASELNHVSDDFQASDQLFSVFILQAETALMHGESAQYEYYKDVLESYNTLH